MTAGSLKIADAVRHIMAAPTKVVFLDTCAVVDVIRAPFRTHINMNVIRGCGVITRKARATPPEAWVFVHNVLRTEYQDYASQTAADLKAHLKALRENVRLFSDASQVAFGSGPAPLGTGATPLEVYLKALADGLVAEAWELEDDDDCWGKALIRSAKNEAPASKKKGEKKDCAIIEHYLSLLAQLRSVGFTEYAAFVTSNVNDFGKPSQLLGRLGEQFAALNLEYRTNLDWVASEL